MLVDPYGHRWALATAQGSGEDERSESTATGNAVAPESKVESVGEQLAAEAF